MIQTFVNIVHVFVCFVVIGVVLLQQGKGGGMGAAFGGATTQVFGGRGAGNILTRMTAIAAATFMITSVSLAYMSSAGDRDLKARVHAEASRKKNKGELKKKDVASPSDSSAPAPSGAPQPGGPDGPQTPPAPAPSP